MEYRRIRQLQETKTEVQFNVTQQVFREEMGNFSTVVQQLFLERDENSEV
jgi:hypothetical protein